MSKKSRRRNRRLLTALAALGGAAMLAGRGRGTAAANVDSGRGSGLRPTVDNMPRNIDKVISDVPVSTPTTIQDSMPRVGMKMGDIRPKNVKSKRVMDDGRVFTIEGAKKGIAPKVGNPKSIFVGKDGSISQGGVTFPNREAFKNRAVMPSNLSRDMGMSRGVVRTPVIDDSFFSDAMAKDGGKIVKTETGGKAVRPKKKTKIQVRGFGKARR
jgi:hypothetical protein